MSEIKQNTLKGSASYSGIALHTGVRATVAVHPADENSGIIFRRVDLPGKPSVRAVAGNVVDVRRGTTIASGNAVVSTVEHILAALSVCNVDNVIVDMDGPEPPIADGSAVDYLDMVLKAEVQEQDVVADIWTPERAITNEVGDSITVIMPAESLKISCVVDYDSCGVLGTQYYSGKITLDEFRDNIAPARTHVEYKDLEQLIAMGLVKGGSLDNAIIMHDGAIISKEKMRYSNELVRHKVLDIIGDFTLIGKRLNAHIFTSKPGHAINVMMLKELFAHM